MNEQDLSGNTNLNSEERAELAKLQHREKLIQSITWCKRIAKLVLGFDLVKNAMQMGTAEVVLLASDLSPKTAKELRYLADQLEYQPLVTPLTMDEYWYLIGKRVGVIAVTDPVFAEKIETLLAEQNSLGCSS